MKVNNKNSIMLTQLYHVYHFQEDDEIKIEKDKKGNFELIVQ